MNGFPFILRILREIIDIRTLCPLHVPKAHFVKRFGSKEQKTFSV